MQANRVKKIIREGGLALGAYVGGIADPQIVEIIGHAGFDSAFIDMEHTSFDLRDVQLMVMAAERVGISPIVRPPGFDPAFLLRLLDMGVQGLQIPHISNAAAARAAVQSVRYPPLGDRGMAGASRATDYGKVPMMEHMAQSNREITLALMIEDQQALDQMDEIAKVEGVDLIVVGPSDMSRTLGVTGTPNHPKLLAVIEQLQKALKNGAGAKLALPIDHPALPRNAGELKAMGCAYANCSPSPEVRLMKSLRAQADEMRKLLA